MWVVALLIASTAIQTSASALPSLMYLSPDPQEPSPEASIALDQAYEAAMEVPAQESCPHMLLDLAKGYAHRNNRRALRLMRHALELIATDPKWVEGERHHGKCVGYFGDEASIVLSARLGLAEVAAQADRGFARRVLAPVAGCETTRSQPAEMFVTLGKAALLILDGDRHAACTLTSQFCEAYPTVVPNVPRVLTRDRALQTLLAFDPDTAIEFASGYDAEFHAVARQAAARCVSADYPRRGVLYYRQALDATLRLPRTSTARDFDRLAVDAIARADVDAAFRLLDEVEGSEVVPDTPAGSQPPTSSIQQVITSREVLDMVDRIRTAIVRYHPNAVYRLNLEKRAGAHDTYILDAALALAKRGQHKRAAKLAGPLREDLRLRVQAETARAVARRDRKRALFLLEEAFREGFVSGRCGSQDLAPVVGELAKLNAAEAVDCYLLLLNRLMPKMSERSNSGYWRSCSILLEGLSKLNGEAALRVLAELPGPRFGRFLIEKKGLDLDILPYLAAANAGIVYDIVKALEPSLRQEAACAVVQRIAVLNPEGAKRFFEFMDTNVPSEARVGAYEIGHDLLSGRSEMESLLETCPTSTRPEPDSPDAHVFPLYEVLQMIAAHSPPRAAELACAIPDTRAKDDCLFFLAHHAEDDFELRSAVAPHITDAYRRARAWQRRF